MKIAAIVGARPDFVKIAPIVAERRTRSDVSTALAEPRPDLVVVVGDVNSTLAGALTASKLGLACVIQERSLRVLAAPSPCPSRPPGARGSKRLPLPRRAHRYP